jgi:acyl-CoA thioesterase
MQDADKASGALGIELVELSAGRAVLRMPVTATMVNGHGIGHGGYLFLLADSAFACACNTRGSVTVAAGADITFVAPVHEGDVLVATAEERTVFGRSGVYDVTVRRVTVPRGGRDGDPQDGAAEAGEVVAEFRGRSRSLRPSGGPG